jgi:hypothetical protein
MRDLLVLQRIANKEDSYTLDESLVELSMFGQPRLGIYNSDMTWHCSVDMFVTGQGIKFEIKSEFSHKTPMEATRVCIQRVHEALSKLTKGD